MMNTNYEIGGVCVRMTADQAERWNGGDTTDDDLDSVNICLPDEYEVRRDGNSGRILHAASRITLRAALDDAELSRMMDGMPANAAQHIFPPAALDLWETV